MPDDLLNNQEDNVQAVLVVSQGAYFYIRGASLPQTMRKQITIENNQSKYNMSCRCWHYLEIHVIEFLCNYARLWVPVGTRCTSLCHGGAKEHVSYPTHTA